MPHAGRGMSTVTTWSKRCASSGSMGNSSGTQYPPQSTWSLAVPHMRRPINHQPSIPMVPNHLRSGQRARCLPPRGGQPRRLRSGRLGRRERWSCGSALPIRAVRAHLLPPLSLLCPHALLRTGLIESFLSMTWVMDVEGRSACEPRGLSTSSSHVVSWQCPLVNGCVP